MAQVHAPQELDWANNTFVALNDLNLDSEKWPQVPNTTFTIPPGLLTQASIERFGQPTPPDELSPASQPPREGSIPVEQLRNETPYSHSNHQTQQVQQESQEPPPKRRRSTKQSISSQNLQDSSSTTPDRDANPQPPKRKRGRPKSQPQMVDAFTADGYPFQVSSARQSHLEKNRVAAHKCRQRKKEYINGLEGRARDFSAKNKALKANVAMLREEVLSLKNEVLRHAGCNFWAVDEYLARCAGDLLGMDASGNALNQQHLSPQDSPSMNANQFLSQRHDSAGSLPSEGIMAESSPEADDFGGLELLRDFDEDDEEDAEDFKVQH